MTADGGGRGVAGLVDRLPEARVLVVGDAMLDRYLQGDVERVSPEAPVPVVRHRETEEAPGGAANVAAGVAALGAECRLVGAVGDDGAGRSLRCVLERAGVEVGGLIEVGGRRTTVKTRVVGRGQQMLRVDRESRAPLGEAGAARAREAAGEALPEVDAVVVADYGKGAVGEAWIPDLIREAARREVPVVADPAPGRLDRFPGADVLTPNRAEAAAARGAGPGREGAGADVGARLEAGSLRDLRRRLDVRHLLVTEGGDGMRLAGPDGGVRRIPGETVEVFDVSGAGDTVAAVLSASLPHGVGVVEAARLANQAAALAVQKLGARAVPLRELRRAAG